MNTYKVRPRDLLDVIDDIKNGSLILAPHFQRKLVWRDNHKIDFIQTILLDYPFPEIFISRGKIDVDTKRSISYVVDGQQRLNTIKEYLDNVFPVDGRVFDDLSDPDKDKFLRYEIAVIDLELNEDDPKIVEIFQRLNRTFYALNAIEKLSTEYASSEFMLIAKLLCGEFQQFPSGSDETISPKNVYPKLHKSDPNITEEFTGWSNSQEIKEYLKFINDSPIFSKYEISRQQHLMYTLNILATIKFGTYTRNEQVKKHLDLYSDQFDAKIEIIEKVNKAARYINKLNFANSSAWHSKSNSFSLFISIVKNYDEISRISAKECKSNLLSFIENQPEDYILAARESVNGKQQRLLREKYINNIFSEMIN
jgi:uncharacterized protein DUF262